jgi:hypothetical protein
VTRQSPEKFARGLDYSFWEHISGYNRTVVKDSAVAERYHIFSSWKAPTKGPDGKESIRSHENYTILEKGSVATTLGNKIPDEVTGGLLQLIDTYEKIRSLPAFDDRQCPIMEFQTDKAGENYFLQYLRTRNEKPSEFTLDREPEDGEFEADFVRGATPPGGIIASVALHYPENFGVPPLESAAFAHLRDEYFSAVMASKRIAEVGFKNFRDYAAGVLLDHILISTVFKPQLFVTSGKLRGVVMRSSHRLREATERDKKPARIKMRIVSDGRKAYVKVLDPKAAAFVGWVEPDALVRLEGYPGDDNE